jgi:hypothetical protein
MSFKRTAEEIAEDQRVAAEIAARYEADPEPTMVGQAGSTASELSAYRQSPVGVAEMAYQRGDEVLQLSLSVMSQQAVIVAMVGSSTTKKTTDPNEILNAVCAQGWEIINGSFVFVVEGEQSRDKFLSSGQNVAVKGQTVGYYVFRRCPQNRQADAS